MGSGVQLTDPCHCAHVTVPVSLCPRHCARVTGISHCAPVTMSVSLCPRHGARVTGISHCARVTVPVPLCPYHCAHVTVPVSRCPRHGAVTEISHCCVTMPVTMCSCHCARVTVPMSLCRHWLRQALGSLCLAAHHIVSVNLYPIYNLHVGWNLSKQRNKRKNNSCKNINNNKQEKEWFAYSADHLVRIFCVSAFKVGSLGFESLSNQRDQDPGTSHGRRVGNP